MLQPQKGPTSQKRAYIEIRSESSRHRPPKELLTKRSSAYATVPQFANVFPAAADYCDDCECSSIRDTGRNCVGAKIGRGHRAAKGPNDHIPQLGFPIHPRVAVHEMELSTLLRSEGFKQGDIVRAEDRHQIAQVEIVEFNRVAHVNYLPG